MGVPQYLCREIPQSFRRKMISFFPKPFDSANAAIFSLACSVGKPLNSPELIEMPQSMNGATVPTADAGLSSDDAATTVRIGSLYFLQNSKSRSSCAGTAMIAPFPYSSNTKFPTQIGSLSPLKGFIAYLPVKNPSFSALEIG